MTSLWIKSQPLCFTLFAKKLLKPFVIYFCMRFHIYCYTFFFFTDMGRPADDIDVTRYLEILVNLIRSDKASKLRGTLKKFSKEQRHRIVSEKSNGIAPLFLACQLGRVQIVNYLLSECEADLEQTGIYEVAEDDSCHEVTPLWCSAVANKLDVVRTLVLQGANVNSPSDTDSTPVRSACYMTNINVVKYLIDHGADIHKPNINGGTCLINSVQSPLLCEYLISKGANVNAQDSSGNIALHYAIREGRFETVKLLISHKSDYKLKNILQDDALQTAALRGHEEIVERLLQCTDNSEIEAIHAYELLGANYVDEKHNISAAMGVWKKAMSMRYSDSAAPILKELPETGNYVYCNIREPQDIDELEDCMSDPNNIYMQALLIRERILGQVHKDTTFGLMYRGAVYADTHRYQRCVDIWKYALILRYHEGEPTNHECLFTLQALIKLIWEMQMELDADSTMEHVEFMDAFEIFEILCKQIQDGKKMLDNPNKSTLIGEDFQLLLLLALHLINLIEKLEASEEQQYLFNKMVHELISADPRGKENETLLHMSVDPKNSLTGDEFYSTFPALSLINKLLECGADVNAVDVACNTPLHNSITNLTHSELQEEGLLDGLLKHGAHVDMCNRRGISALDLMRSRNVVICPLLYLSLKCLASRVIMKHSVPYHGEVPRTLIPFIEMHGSV